MCEFEQIQSFIAAANRKSLRPSRLAGVTYHAGFVSKNERRPTLRWNGSSEMRSSGSAMSR